MNNQHVIPTGRSNDSSDLSICNFFLCGGGRVSQASDLNLQQVTRIDQDMASFNGCHLLQQLRKHKTFLNQKIITNCSFRKHLIPPIVLQILNQKNVNLDRLLFQVSPNYLVIVRTFLKGSYTVKINLIQSQTATEPSNGN